jgi:hypothetical protein
MGENSLDDPKQRCAPGLAGGSALAPRVEGLAGIPLSPSLLLLRTQEQLVASTQPPGMLLVADSFKTLV